MIDTAPRDRDESGDGWNDLQHRRDLARFNLECPVGKWQYQPVKANTSLTGNASYTIGWADAEALEKTLTGGVTLLAQLAKLKQSFSKRRRPKRDLKKLGEEIDELQKNLITVCDLMSRSTKSRTRFVEAVAGAFAANEKARVAFGVVNLPKIIKIVLAHEARLNALETSAAAGKGKTPRKRKRKSANNS